MITTITKIKNLGIFKDYSVSNDILSFSKLNLIYGLNASGKTTFSELFTIFNGDILEDFPDVEYKFMADQQSYSQSQSYDKSIRVFNKRYISENVDVVSGKAKAIIMLGKEDIELNETIKQDEQTLHGDIEKDNDFGKIKELQSKKDERSQKEKEKSKQFTNIARTISVDRIGTSVKNYDKRNAENTYNSLSGKRILSDEEKQLHSGNLRQEQKEVLPLADENVLDGLNKIIEDSMILLEKTVETLVIERLKEHSDISKWVEEGIALHKQYKSDNCEFCDQPLPENRIPSLLSYFNDADRSFKRDIDSVLSRIRALCSQIRELKVTDKASLYSEFQEKYVEATNNITTHKNELLSKLENLEKEVSIKKQKTTTSVTLKIDIDADQLISSITKVNSFITDCNGKTTNFSKEREASEKKLENHYLSLIHDDVQELEVDIQKLKANIKHLEEGNPDAPNDMGIQAIQNRIKENKTKISASGVACEKINDQLKTFLGRDEITFEVSQEGYTIKRNGVESKNLSESEKTAIAFVYFTIHLEDQDFDIKNGIVVIDDPISSLDSNSMFQSFSFLKNSVKEAHQSFILTHNFEFLQLLLRWTKYVHGSCYMINNHFDPHNNRVAELDSLDPLLSEYNSEYQYLFKLLSVFESDGTIKSVYHIPNIARKVLENFLTVMSPNGDNTFKKLDNIIFDKHKKTAIYEFTNSQSHMTGSGFDPSLVSECQNNVKYLLEMMGKVFPEHFKVLQEAISQ